jgi:excinuclease ABC subunit C
MKAFDRKFGPLFLSSIPTNPGIYRIYNSDSSLIYVGKAKNLRKRLSQYRGAKAKKKQRKMRRIIQDAARIEVEVCESHLDAVVKETQAIQASRPKWNVVGAFSFLYPFIGIQLAEDSTFFCYTTKPQLFSGFDFHGSFRSRRVTRDAFYAWVSLLTYVCHPISKVGNRKHPVPKYSYLVGFRQFPQEWRELWSLFLRGESNQLLEILVLELLENAGARSRTKEVQELLHCLSRFWKKEAVPLFRVRSFCRCLAYPVEQKERDLLFLKYQLSRNEF